MTPLNPTLHAQLKRVFGEVKYQNEGVGFSGTVGRDPLRPKRKKLTVENHGEQYLVCCPFCQDTRFRLYFNHRWGTYMGGEKLLHLVQCFNEGCQTRPFFHVELEEMLSNYASVGGRVEVAEGRVKDEAPKEINLPGRCYPITDLPDTHMAVHYLKNIRGFDIQELWDQWAVMWCDYSRSAKSHQRILFPIYNYNVDGDLKMMGYQCRYLNLRTGSGKPPDKMTPKYASGYGTKKSKLLYNAYRSCYKPLVVLTEGPLDAIRVGTEFGVCAFGKSISPKHAELLWLLWGQYGATVVVALDPDAEEEHRKTMVKLETTWPAGKVIPLIFPEGEDPGGTERSLLYRMIIDAGLKVGTDLRAYFS